MSCPRYFFDVHGLGNLSVRFEHSVKPAFFPPTPRWVIPNLTPVRFCSWLWKPLLTIEKLKRWIDVASGVGKKSLIPARTNWRYVTREPFSGSSEYWAVLVRFFQPFGRIDNHLRHLCRLTATEFSQNRPIHIGTEFFARDFSARSGLDVWAALRWYLASAGFPLRDHHLVDIDCGCQIFDRSAFFAIFSELHDAMITIRYLLRNSVTSVFLDNFSLSNN